MGRHVLRCHIWGYSVLLCPIKRKPGLFGLIVQFLSSEVIVFYLSYISAFENEYLHIYMVNQRACFNCNESVKSERHVLFHCHLFDDLQYEMFSVASQVNPQFNILNNDEKIVFLFSSANMVKAVAKTCIYILDRRRFRYQ